jgi:hypothetical protein
MALSVPLRVPELAAKRRQVFEQRGPAGRLGGLGGDHSQLVVRQRARLVQAHDVDRGEALDRVEPLRQRSEPCQPHRRDGEREAGEQDQPFGHEREEAGDHRAAGLLERRVADGEHPDEQQRERHHHGDRDAQHPVDVLLERTQPGDGPAGLRSQSLREAVAAHGLDHVVAGAGHAVGAREQRVARRSLHGIALAGQDRFVERERPCPHDAPVGDDLISRLHPDHVAGHDVARGQVAQPGIPVDARAGRHEEREPVEHALGANLLRHPDQDVRDQHAGEQAVAVVAQGHDHGEQRGEDRVEEREDVRTDDVRVRPAPGRPPAPGSLGQAPARLLARQARGRLVVCRSTVHGTRR